jgi:hypothetical protein
MFQNGKCGVEAGLRTPQGAELSRCNCKINIQDGREAESRSMAFQYETFGEALKMLL